MFDLLPHELEFCGIRSTLLNLSGCFRAKHPPLLAVWGKNNPFFLPRGAEAFKRDNPREEVHFYETGHVVLETHPQEIADAIRDFLSGNVKTHAKVIFP